MFINLTNHPSSGWSESQLKAAQEYGEVVDIPFPLVDEQATETEIKRLADEYVSIIKSKGKPLDLTVHIMGEQTFCYALISKLQKEGIRCVASCTEHDNFINEQGQKVSTFHFARFREYVPPRALRWWKKLKASFFSVYDLITPNCFKKKRFYCWTALLFVLTCEFLLVIWQTTGCLFAIVLAIIIACLLPLLFLISRINGLNFSIRSAIVSKLLANTIAPTRLGTFYLFSFIIHIGWLTNVILGLFTDFDEVAFPALVCVLAMIVLVVFFPTGKEDKADTPKKIFISGISAINYAQHNLTPLIRILQLTDKNDTSCELFILHSDYYSNPDNEEWVSENYRKYFKEAFELILKRNPKYSVKKVENTTNKLEILIKMAAINMFPDKTWIPEGLKVTFSEQTDYNRFESCYGVLDKFVKEKDNEKSILYFNLTPGTGIVGSLMTLMAIDGDRSLYYYSQNTRLKEDKRLKEVDKSQIPLKNLLSQALEKLEYNK